ncbi:hypothetical protein [Roseibium sp.]|uniref:hypothetical protein n=1 Tax=Roseibium sp. TaxID=1936156 RepID=UPI003A98780D
MAFDAAVIAARITAGADLVGSGFPRELSQIAPLTLPISITMFPNLTTDDVAQALAKASVKAGRPIRNRRLRGCLVAHHGRGIIFLDEDDPALQRFALAHELSHFVGHYLARRELAIARMGLGIVEVLDGLRPSTPQERLAGILSGCPLGAFADLMEREGGIPLSAEAEIMEYEADEAAFLALAPIGIVIAETTERFGRIDRSTVTQALTEVFGLSDSDANRHAPRIVNAAARNKPSFISQLRKAASDIKDERHR